MRFASITLVFVLACSSAPQDTPERRAFIAKADRALRPSAAPLSADVVDQLVALDDDDIIAALYADSSARDSVFALSLSFLGASVDELHTNGAWAEPPFVYAPAVAAARAFRESSDPLVPLFTTQADLPRGIVVAPRAQTDLGLTLTGSNAEQRAYVERFLLDDIAKLRAAVAALPAPFDTNAMCNDYNMTFTSFVGFELPDVLGMPTPITTGGYPKELENPDMFPLQYACPFGQPVVATTQAAALAHLDSATQLFTQLFTRVEPFMVAWEQDAEGAFDPVDFSSIGFENYATQAYYGRTGFYPQFWTNLQNSSTNFDRRRGAYVLDRFFCDNLIPVGAALPTTDPSSGKHASDPACAACHFKLDPMAGFFRRHGYLGTEFTDQTLAYSQNMITFDDNATLDYTQYDSAWKSTDGFSPPYNVGYIRSTSNASLNSYGNSLDDLDTIVKSAPEVERCFAQRMFEFFNGADQAVDPGYLDDVAADMASAGGDRLERGITRILTGHTFRADDRNSTVCYDLAPGASANGGPPCEVASILRANCTTCHGGGNPQSGLDLSSWVKLDNGYGFKDIVNGQQVARLITLQNMSDRVTTSDPSLQMPMGKDMPLAQRDQLAVWLQHQLGQ